jgi:hypothetical protein
MKETLLLRFMEAYGNLSQTLTDLGLWRIFKMKCSVSFRGMYQFWVSKSQSGAPIRNRKLRRGVD